MEQAHKESLNGLRSSIMYGPPTCPLQVKPQTVRIHPPIRAVLTKT